MVIVVVVVIMVVTVVIGDDAYPCTYPCNAYLHIPTKHIKTRSGTGDFWHYPLVTLVFVFRDQGTALRLPGRVRRATRSLAR